MCLGVRRVKYGITAATSDEDDGTGYEKNNNDYDDFTTVAKEVRGSYVKYDVDSGQLNSYTKKFSLCHRINKAFYVVSVKVVVEPLPVTVKY